MYFLLHMSFDSKLDLRMKYQVKQSYSKYLVYDWIQSSNQTEGIF